MFLEKCKASGSIEVVCGSMFSGKTEELIRRMKRAVFANQKVVIFKPAVDVRYSEDHIVSHDAHSLESVPVKTASEIPDRVGGAEVVGVDEAQFFGADLIDVVTTLAERGLRVIVAGLDMDFAGKPFGPMPALMALAEDVQKVHAVCVRCGSPAQFSHRLSRSHKLVVLGEKDKYEPLCRQCYREALAQDLAEEGQRKLF